MGNIFTFPKITKEKKEKSRLNKLSNNYSEKNENLILKEFKFNKNVVIFFRKYFDLSQESTFITSTSTRFNIDNLSCNKYNSIVNLKKVNDVRFINKFFESVNSRLPYSGLYFGRVLTYPNRKKALLKKYPTGINWLVYFFDLFFNRVFPKLKITKRIYFYLTKGKGRVVSKAEIFGRLYSCGFEIIDEKSIDNIQYFVAKKIKEPFYDDTPTYGPIIRLKRIGKNKEKISVYKIRTMHPFSEYLQEYVYKKNNLQKGGKIKDDFRITPEGKLFRKFWIDEIPMLFNILKGDMKLVGVRPLSPHFFGLYDEELQELRTKFKPGFIPPFYVDLPNSMSEILESEKKYLKAFEKAPFKTDFIYLYKSLKNVMFGGARSC